MAGSAAKKTTKKAPVKAPAKKAPAKKAPPKAPAKKAPAKKAAAKAPAKKAPAKKAPATKAPAKKAPAKQRRRRRRPRRPPPKKAAPRRRAHQVAVRQEVPRRAARALLEERATLAEQAEALKAEADSLTEDREPGDVQFDEESGEGDTLAVERERDLARGRQARQTIEEIDAALERITKGTYGICESPGEPIPKERLKAIPWARERVEYKIAQLPLTPLSLVADDDEVIAHRSARPSRAALTIGRRRRRTPHCWWIILSRSRRGAVDQLTKWWALESLDGRRPIDLVWTLRFNLAVQHRHGVLQGRQAGPLIALLALASWSCCLVIARRVDVAGSSCR